MFEKLKIDCENCFALCCTALYFSKSDGFPTDKESGTPCTNLQKDFRCKIHNTLLEKGMKGCTNFDCFGAGQKVSQFTFKGKNWKEFPELSKKMFEVFSVMVQLHEMMWYLSEIIVFNENSNTGDSIIHLKNQIENLTYLDSDSLLSLDILSYREKTGLFLKQVIDKTKTINSKNTIGGRLDLIGADLRKKNLKYVDLKGAFLIAADLRSCNLIGVNFLGADLRDADIRGADLRQSFFLTQSQINSAIGNLKTKLPEHIEYPKKYKI